MKKIFLLGAFVLLCSSTFAQQLFTSLAFNASTTKQNDVNGSTTLQDVRYFNYGIIPRIGYYITPKFIAGVDLGYLRNVTNATKPTSYKGVNNQFILGLFGRYMHKFNDYIGVWTELKAYGGLTKSTIDGADNAKGAYVGTQITPGLILFAGSHLSFEMSYGGLDYQYGGFKPANNAAFDKRTYSRIDLLFNLSNTRFAVNYSF